MNVTPISIGKKATRSDMSRQVEEQESFALDSGNRAAIIQTPYSMKNLHDLYERSNTLRQCVEAYVTNMTSNGWEVVPYEEGASMDQQEVRLLKSFIESPNTDESLRSVSSKIVNYYEKYGFTFTEVVRNAQGVPTLLRAANPAAIRMTSKDREEIEVRMTVRRGGRRSRIVERKRFRQYVQQVGTQKVYYKQFGDPRDLNYKSGIYSEAGTLAPELRATELIHHKQLSEDPYGVPRWISMLPSILGSREAEEVNLRYFEDNTVPPMILSVAGGRLTRQSFLDLQSILSGTGLGRDRQNQIMLLEAVPEVADIDGKEGTVSLKLDKLTDARQSDGLFKDYDDANMAKVRSAFRLPPVFLGMSQDMTFATANVSAYIAEVQVFGPERQIHDEFLNKKFVNHPNGLNLRTVKLQSRGPSNTSPEQVVKTLTSLNVMGGLTPRTAIDAVNQTMRMSIPQYPAPNTEGWMEWMDQPMAYSLSANKTQQTGEGQSTHEGQSMKDQEQKDTEDTGETNPSAPEHGQE
jgi:PBSX family phage portal protein